MLSDENYTMSDVARIFGISTDEVRSRYNVVENYIRKSNLKLNNIAVRDINE